MFKFIHKYNKTVLWILIHLFIYYYLWSWVEQSISCLVRDIRLPCIIVLLGMPYIMIIIVSETLYVFHVNIYWYTIASQIFANEILTMKMTSKHCLIALVNFLDSGSQDFDYPIKFHELHNWLKVLKSYFSDFYCKYNLPTFSKYFYSRTLIIWMPVWHFNE